MKVVENSPQDPRNCTILKNFLGGACPQTPLAKACIYKIPEILKLAPPLRNPAYAPEILKKAPMLCDQFLPKKAPMLSVNFLPKKPPCYALNFHLKRPPPHVKR